MQYYFQPLALKMRSKKSILSNSNCHTKRFTIQATFQEIEFLARLLPRCFAFEKLDGKQKNSEKRSTLLKKLGSSQLLQTCEDLPKTRSSNKILNKLSKDSCQKKSSVQYLEDIEESQFLDFRFCMSILGGLKKHSSSWPFQYPVDPKQLGVPEYFQIIKEPMDLWTIETKLKQGQYLHDSQFEADVRKIISNSYMFNEGNTEYIKPTKIFQKHFLKLLRKFEKERIQERRSLGESESEMKGVTLMQKNMVGKQIKSLSRKQKEVVMKIAYGSEYRDRILDINNLEASKLRKIQKFVSKMSSVEAQEQDREQFGSESSFCTNSSSSQERQQ